MMVAELDCESAHTARVSLAGLLGISTTELVQRIADLSPDPLSQMAGTGTDTASLLWDQLTTGTQEAPSAIFWFHATRVLPDASFQTEGILPLKAMFPRIRSKLKELMKDCPDAQRQDTEGLSPVENLSALVMRLELPEAQGPDAFLVHESIFDKSGAQHDFLDAPEAVVDVASMVTRNGAVALFECFRRVSRPCIVKFRSTDPDPRAAPAALHYVYDDHWELGLPDPPHTIGMNGRAVSPSAVVAVDFVDS